MTPTDVIRVHMLNTLQRYELEDTPGNRLLFLRALLEIWTLPPVIFDLNKRRYIHAIKREITDTVRTIA